MRSLDLAAWAIPLAVAAIMKYQGRVPGFTPTKACAAIVGVGIVLLVQRRPAKALAALIVVLPFQTFLSSWLVVRGLPFDLVRLAGYWKDIVAVGVLIAGYRTFRRGTRTLDALDYLAIAFVVFVLAYAVAPSLFAPDAPTDLTIRYVAYRQTASFVLLFLAVRHLRLSNETFLRLARLAVVVAAVTAAAAVYEFAFSDSWNNFVVNTLGMSDFLRLSDAAPVNPNDLRIYSQLGGNDILRVQSVFLSLGFGFYLLPALALTLGRLGSRRVGARTGPLLLVIGAALILTQTRSALLGGAVIVLLTLWYTPDRRVADPAGKARLGLILVAVLLLAAPLAVQSGLVDRLLGGATAADTANQEHQDSLQRGWTDLLTTPLGNGLGTVAGTGQRFGTEVVVADNTYLAVGNEVGVVPMAIFAVFMVAVAIRIRRTRGAVSPEVAAMSHAALGLALGGFLLQVWLDLAVSWTFWMLAAAALSQVDRLRTDDAGPSGARFGDRSPAGRRAVHGASDL